MQLKSVVTLLLKKNKNQKTKQELEGREGTDFVDK